MIEKLVSPVAQHLTLTLLHFLWQGFLIGGGYWALTALFGVKSPQVRYVSALLALIAMVLSPTITFLATDEPMPVSQGGEEFVADRGSLPLPHVGAISGHPVKSMHASTPEAPAGTLLDESTRGMRKALGTRRTFWSVRAAVKTCHPLVLLMWLAGVVLSGARLTTGLLNVFWLQFGRSRASQELLDRSLVIARRMQLRSARVVASERVRVAAVVGFWKPVVLLPISWLTEMPPDVLQAVIAHELAHVRRLDVWVNLFQRLVETLLFYHPMVWWLSNRIRFERELGCDELAVAATGDCGNYVMALEQVGRLEVRGTLRLAPAITGEKKMNLLHRVEHVLGISRPHREPAWFVGMLAVASTLAIAGVIGGLSDSNTVLAQQREGGQSAEAEAGPRRSAEADAGPRRSAEADAGPRRSPEGDRAAVHSAEGDRAQPMSGFRPQTPREATLYQMILQLQREVAALRREVRTRARGDGDRFPKASREGDFTRREGDSARQDGDSAQRDRDWRDGERTDGDRFELPANWQRTKEGRVFMAYDKNGDETVTLDEWLVMTNSTTESRRELGTQRFQTAEPSGDGKFTPAEFIWWRRVGSRQAIERDRPSRSREGDGDRGGDGDGRRPGPRDGDSGSNPRGPRDGEGDGMRRGPRDGDGPSPRSRDGDG